MNTSDVQALFGPEACGEIFPPSRTNDFFDAMFGDAEEGAYDIELAFSKAEGSTLHFNFLLKQRPGRCLACNLTYGLPQVFQRHPLLNVAGVVKSIGERLGQDNEGHWELGATREMDATTHCIPLLIQF